jgi:succinyl-CoA synthetase alpha subunit
MSVNDKIDYLFSKINWADSALDATAVEIMTNLKEDIKQESEKNALAYAELRGQVDDLFERVSNCRSYLMETENVTVEDALESLGYGRNGLRFC